MSIALKSTQLDAAFDALAVGTFGDVLAVAVSGGADSLCLALSAADWAKKHNKKIVALTVDHGLRPESAKEARLVHVWLLARGISHHTLKWAGQKPSSRVEELARLARYDLLIAWCKKHKVSCLLVGHQLEDQTETFLIRLAHASGVDGLSAMQPVSVRQGVFIARPFLHFHRAQLQATLTQKYQQKWVEDPSNQDNQYERVRYRQSLPVLQELGLTTEAVGLSVKRLARVRACLEELTHSFMKKKVQITPAGFAFINTEDMASVPAEIAIRVLGRVLRLIGGEISPRLEQLEKLYVKLPCSVTLAGCEIVPYKDGFFICREVAKMAQPLLIEAKQTVQWDRFVVFAQKDVTVAPLRESIKVKLPAKVRRTVPAFYIGKKLVSVPYLDYYAVKDDINGTIAFKDITNG